jgi:6-methylsalicylate decarboxylase
MSRTDVHQHLWPEGFVAALARRTVPPRLRRSGATWLLELRGEPAMPFAADEHDADRRRLQGRASGIDRIVLAPSLPLGIEALRGDEARALLDLWHDGVLALGEPFGVWGSVAAQGARAGDVDHLLDRGCVGLALPAATLGSPAGLDRTGPLLEALARRGAPLLVHPGPAPAGRAPAPWWPALTSYVADLQAAWLTWASWGRRAHPALPVLFAALAGGAPMQSERLAARGGPTTGLGDPLAFYDTSSYGTHAIEAVGRLVGIDQLVFGSDRPVVGRPAPHGLGAAADAALTEANPARLLAAGAPAVAA